MYCNVMVVVVGSARLRCWVDGLIGCRDFKLKRERQRESGEERECVWRDKKYLNNEIESYNNCVYIHSYYSYFGYLQSFTRANAGVFYVILCKFLYFLYFRSTDAVALRNEISKVKVLLLC